MSIPIIDIFAGPGGLGEGFSALTDPKTGKRVFKISLSIEKEKFAHQTLTLRSFFRQFPIGGVPSDYYEFIKGKISLDELYKKWPEQSESAKKEAWKAQLGEGEKATPNKVIDDRIQEALDGESNWLLIGGPPCQAYSVVGRSRRQETILNEDTDARVGLYKQYLRILAVHNPAVFVMENVKGLLSAKTESSPVFSRILNDLADPVKAYLSEYKINGVPLLCPGYKIYSLVVKPNSFDLEGNPQFSPKDFIIYSEKHGVPQTRHRVILLGVRKDIDSMPDILLPEEEVSVANALSGLPKLRSGLSKSKDDGENWKRIFGRIIENGSLLGVDSDILKEIEKQVQKLSIPHKGTGADFILSDRIRVEYQPNWYLDERLQGVCNHTSRGHMESDLFRYLFATCFAHVRKRSPKIDDFPTTLLPAHKNVQNGNREKKFADRFRVQLSNKPCKTITSHISKDGHYYIHPDSTQCRSFTVREAARIQTFPDNYYFCGPRTSQFIQVGNAVPPYLAFQMAKIVKQIFSVL